MKRKLFLHKELEKYRLMGILRKGSSEFLSPVMLIKKSHDGSRLNAKQEYRMVVDFKHLNSHLPDIKFSYPEVKHILHKIGRSESDIYSVFIWDGFQDLRLVVSGLHNVGATRLFGLKIKGKQKSY